MTSATASTCFTLFCAVIIQGQFPERKHQSITPNAHTSPDAKDAVSPRMRSGDRT